MKIFDLKILSSSTDELVGVFLRSLKYNKKLLLAFANVNTLNISYESKEYNSLLKNFHIVNDGVGVDIAAKILYSKTFLQNLNGTDFMPELFSRLPSGSKVFFLEA